jgi:hypothetical protein
MTAISSICQEENKSFYTMFGNKVLLRWKEPRSALEQVKKQLTWKNWAIGFGRLTAKFTLGGLAVGIVVAILASFGGHFRSFDFLIVLSIFAGFGAALGILGGLITLANLLISPEVTIREKGIGIFTAHGETFFFPFQNIQNCSIEKHHIEEKEVYFLVIGNRKGNESFIEIAPNIKSDDIIEILKTKNIEVKSSHSNAT